MRAPDQGDRFAFLHSPNPWRAQVQVATLQLHVASSGPAATTLLAFAVGNATRWNEVSEPRANRGTCT